MFALLDDDLSQVICHKLDLNTLIFGANSMHPLLKEEFDDMLYHYHIAVKRTDLPVNHIDYCKLIRNACNKHVFSCNYLYLPVITPVYYPDFLMIKYSLHLFVSNKRP